MVRRVPYPSEAAVKLEMRNLNARESLQIQELAGRKQRARKSFQNQK